METRPELTEEELCAMNAWGNKYPCHPNCPQCTGRYKAISGTTVMLAICPKCGNDVWYQDSSADGQRDKPL